MGRVLNASLKFKVDIIVEITGDCPIIDPEIISLVLNTHLENKCDYTSNCNFRSYPDGMDVQVFSRMVLEDVAERTTNPEDLEHVSSYIYKNPDLYSLYNITAPQSQLDPRLRLTLDTIEDFNLIQIIFETLYPHNNVFSLDNILAFLKEHPELRKINQLVPHNWLQQIKPGE